MRERELPPARITTIAALIASSCAVFAQEAPREQIGMVLGKAVFRDQLTAEKDADPAEALHRVFIAPVWEAYKAAHTAELTPSEREIEFALAYFRKKHDEEMKRDGEKLRRELAEAEKRLKKPDLDEKERRSLRGTIAATEHRMRPPQRLFAEYMLAHRKLQRQLYQKFGGGRVLFQQAGLEAFDAMHEFLKQQEKDGAFRIDDVQLRKQIYAYWTTMDHGAFLTSDEEQIREFVNPPWLLVAETQPASQPRPNGK